MTIYNTIQRLAVRPIGHGCQIHQTTPPVPVALALTSTHVRNGLAMHNRPPAHWAAYAPVQVIPHQKVDPSMIMVAMVLALATIMITTTMQRIKITIHNAHMATIQLYRHNIHQANKLFNLSLSLPLHTEWMIAENYIKSTSTKQQRQKAWKKNLTTKQQNMKFSFTSLI